MPQQPSTANIARIESSHPSTQKMYKIHSETDLSLKTDCNLEEQLDEDVEGI